MRKIIIDHYRKFMGKDLPPRELVIKFAVPQPLQKTRMPKLSDLKPMHLPNELVAHAEILRAFIANLRQLNQCPVRPGRRFAYTEKVARKLMPLALQEARDKSGEGLVPDPQERREMLELVAEATRRLLDSYRLVFKTLYQTGNFRFARAEKSFDLCCYRILELSRFQQRVLALRYRVLPEVSWLAINTVFQVMHMRGRSEIPFHGFDEIYGDEHKKHSAKELFLIMQMIARLDVLRWPSEWHFSLDSYGRIAHALVKLEEDDGNIVRPDYSIAYCYDDQAARARRIPGQTTRGSALLLNWKNLKAKLLRDYERNLQRQAQAIDEKAFALLSFNDGLALLELQKKCWLHEPAPVPARDAPGEKCDVRMFIGFKGIYPFLFNLHYGTGATETIGSRMVDLLAQRSALFAEDHRSTHDSVWVKLEEDARHITLRTQETDYTTQMRIGALAAYGFGAEGMRSSSIGVISRIYRPPTPGGNLGEGVHLVVIDIDLLGEFSEPILVTPDLQCFEEFDNKNKEICYGVLAINKLADGSEECSLLLPAHSHFLQGHQLVMKRVGLRQIIQVGALLSASKTYRRHAYQVQISVEA